MDRRRWKRVRDVLDRSLEMSEEERAAFVIRATEGDASLRHEVESLLRHSDVDGMLDHPLRVQVPESPAEVNPFSEPVPRQVDEIDVTDLPPDTVVDITTTRSRYRVVVVAPLLAEVTVTGGERFPHPTHAVLLQGDRIRSGSSVVFRVDGRRVTTSSVERIEISPRTS